MTFKWPQWLQDPETRQTFWLYLALLFATPVVFAALAKILGLPFDPF